MLFEYVLCSVRATEQIRSSSSEKNIVESMTTTTTTTVGSSGRKAEEGHLAISQEIGKNFVVNIVLPLFYRSWLLADGYSKLSDNDIKVYKIDSNLFISLYSSI